MNTADRKLKCFFIFFSAAIMAVICAFQPAFAGQEAKARFYLVSVGVGDSDLITLRAINTIKASDIVICGKDTEKQFAEYLKGKIILDGSRSAWRSYRKSCDKIEDPEKKASCLKSAESRGELISQIRSTITAGKTVSVLGSGDLLIYGGPYHWYLREFADLNPQIIPGVSCFNAANAIIGKEIMAGKGTVLTTYRGIDDLSGSHPTMVIFTMHTDFKDLVEKLKKNYPPETPIAIVFHAGYRDKEYLIKARLDTIMEKTRGKKFPFEHLVYVGNFMN